MKAVNYVNGNYIAISQNSGSNHQNSRTPIAWHNRNVNLSKPSPQTTHTLPNHISKYRRASAHRSSQRPSSPSATTTSSDDREEVPMVRHPPRRPNSRITLNGIQTIDNRSLYNQTNRHQNYHQFNNHFTGTLISGEYGVPIRGYRTGTLRSTKSVPTLAMSTLDGEPCPVHHNDSLSYPCHPSLHPINGSQTLNFRRFGSIADVLDPRVPSNHLAFLAPIPENKQSSGLLPISVPYYPPPQPPPSNIPLHLLPPKMQTRPVIFPAYSEPHALPIRDPFKMSSPSNAIGKYGASGQLNSDDVCCRGHLIVLWIILGVVTVGVISGIILAVTMN